MSWRPIRPYFARKPDPRISFFGVWTLVSWPRPLIAGPCGAFPGGGQGNELWAKCNRVLRLLCRTAYAVSMDVACSCAERVGDFASAQILSFTSAKVSFQGLGEHLNAIRGRRKCFAFPPCSLAYWPQPFAHDKALLSTRGVQRGIDDSKSQRNSSSGRNPDSNFSEHYFYPNDSRGRRKTSPMSLPEVMITNAVSVIIM